MWGGGGGVPHVLPYEFITLAREKCAYKKGWGSGEIEYIHSNLFIAILKGLEKKL